MQQKQFCERKALRFKHFSHKGYALFSVMGREVLIGTLSVATLSHAKAEGISVNTEATGDSLQRSELKLEEVVVTGSRAPLTLAESAKIVSVITREDIHRAAAESINDILKLATGVDVRQRGGFGVQTDISVRGGNFDQITILLNGVNISSPHTGHLSADFPVSPEDIERIEVLEGPAARVYGTSAFNGVINIVTAVPESAPSLRERAGGEAAVLSLSAGQYGYAHANASLAKTFGSTHHALSGGYTRTDGATPNSAFTSSRVFYHATAEIGANATLSGQGSYTTADTGYGTGIYSKIEGLTIQLQGDNTVTGKTNCHGVYLGSETTIKGEGSMEATGYFGIYLHDKSLTINNGAKVKAIGQGGGGLIGFKNYSTGEYNSTLCIQHRASVTATDPFGSIINWKNLFLLDRRAIVSPSNAVWSDHAVRDADSGDYITSTVTIDAAKYKLWIANQQVTADNQNDILGDGLISYNENTNTLHLAGTHQYSGGNHFINNEIPGLTIEAEGDPAYIIARTSAIKSKADLTITGNVLSVSSSEDCGVWLENNARLTIRNMPYFSVSESQWGICGSMSSSAHESLSIQSSKVYVKADVEAVCDFRGGINLSLCGIEVPVGGKVVNGRIVDQNGGTVKEVMISKEATPTDIDALQPDTESQTTDSNDGWYTLDGRKLNGMPAEKGVYIRNGRKVLK